MYPDGVYIFQNKVVKLIQKSLYEVLMIEITLQLELSICIFQEHVIDNL
jgi:hypothetical protein